MAAVLVAIFVLSLVPTTSAASKPMTSTGTCDAGYSHARTTKMTSKFDSNHNGWICSQTMRSKGKTTHEHRDDKVV